MAQRAGRTAAACSALALVDARRPVVRGRKGAHLLVAVAAACSRATVKTVTVCLFVSFVPFEGRRSRLMCVEGSVHAGGCFATRARSCSGQRMTG